MYGSDAMDLDVSLERASNRGRPPKRIEGEVVKALRAEDLVLLDLDRGVKAPPLKKLRDAHHSIARLLAQGRQGVEIALITGYSQSRISILKADPAFQELVLFYEQQNSAVADEAFVDAQSKLAAVNRDAIEELHDRLQDEPEKIGTDELLDIVKVTSDRTGNGPQAKNMNVNVNVDLAARIAAGRARAKLAQVSPPGLLTSASQGEEEPEATLAPSSPKGGDG